MNSLCTSDSPVLLFRLRPDAPPHRDQGDEQQARHRPPRHQDEEHPRQARRDLRHRRLWPRGALRERQERRGLRLAQPARRHHPLHVARGPGPEHARGPLPGLSTVGHVQLRTGLVGGGVEDDQLQLGDREGRVDLRGRNREEANGETESRILDTFAEETSSFILVYSYSYKQRKREHLFLGGCGISACSRFLKCLVLSPAQNICGK